MKRAMLLMKACLIMTPVATLAGCGTSGPADVSGLRRVAGTDLIGARGATDADQRKIDRTVVRFCAGGVWTRKECGLHGESLAAPR
ncbi:hypothetical protein HFO09_23135 [Rhizobium laguerreae]|uniref:hypothetical protein n=1 Tax=Rhizobium laguerreae TaxID=1076926 RepID=UPI001C922A33|nr:hypothetical protein [Rhizobium laguerreae]MBY3257051.1 hypothetical protein [Rhizobium laguerreae]MBY3282412.1 hypothetical protein [Rhizobium laguerreae]MBY3291939.1 hypothetical protein [Rhizobium laguerreae]